MEIALDAKYLFTEFAPAERSTPQEIIEQVEAFSKEPILSTILDFVPDVVLILNSHRQIVFANCTACQLLKSPDKASVFGLRPGELLACEHASETASGCGTSRACSTCGAVKAIMAAFEGRHETQECRVIQKTSGVSFDLRIYSYPWKVQDTLFDVFIAVDISNEKRRSALERIFFHDIMNTASGIYSFAQILEEVDFNEFVKFKGSMSRLSVRLIDEINSQRDLLKAENNELTLHTKTVNTRSILEELAELYSKHDLAAGKQLVIDPFTQSAEMTTDGVLLSRVLGNLVKNALEASEPGQTVTLGCCVESGKVSFWVHNSTYILPEIQLQIFQRSFSTKGTGRGLGTYSIRLLTERYLKGKVSFTSTKEQGTRFVAEYPLVYPEDSLS
jgi:signal transduction histidine kinase